MLKIKLFAVAGIFALVAIVLSSAPVFVSKAENDSILREIAAYKSWYQITKKPLEFKIDGASGSE